ncbi:MAG: hypothetical protein JXQ67_07135 [Campylobacterales bacterium]|nr:hypothetical protein [Campylobacterales bacterium]
MRKRLLLLIAILLSACSSPTDKQLVLTTNSWIGYTPLFYANEKGYLDELNIKLITTVSLGESVNIFLVSKADMLTGTQHEYNLLNKEMHSVVPIMLLDRSDGGDMILSNKTLEELKKSEHIEVYLEVDSINKEIIENFIAYSKLDSEHMTFINKDQAQIQNLKYSTKKDILIVTYAPHNIELENTGFKELASTKNPKAILVIDALFTRKELLYEHQERLKRLQIILEKSIKEIMQDKATAHKLTQKYLNDISYKEFNELLNTIKWINKPSEELLDTINASSYPTGTLL